MNTSEKLSREQILALPAGPELDRLIAERILPWQGGNPIPNYDGRWPWPPPFSTDIAAAWLVVEELRKRFTNLSLHAANGWGLTCWTIGYGGVAESNLTGPAHADAAPLAICRTLLLAMEVKR